LSAHLAQLIELIKSVANPEENADIASRLKRVGQGELISEVAKLSRLVDRSFTQAFITGLNGALRRALEELSSALEELHDVLISTRPWMSEGEELILRLIAHTLSDVGEAVERLMSSQEIDIRERARGIEEARVKLEGAADLVRRASSLGSSPSAQEVLSLVESTMPDEKELATYIVVMEAFRDLSKEGDFYKALAELISSWFVRSGRARRGCTRPADIRAWASDVLKMEVARRDLRRALKLLQERGDIVRGRSKRGLLVIRPREEDLKAAFELARERYRDTGSGINAQLLSQRFDWCVEYASALIDELVRRRWLFPGPSQLIPGAEEYYPPPEDEGP